MPNCAVSGCKNHNRRKDAKDLKFYTLPKNKDLALQWVSACHRQDNVNLKNVVICSKHFESKYFITSLKYKLLNETPPKGFRNLHDDAVPTLFLPKTASSTSTSNEQPQMTQVKTEAESRRAIIEELLLMESKVAAEKFAKECEINMKNLAKELKDTKLKMLILEKEVERLKLENKELINTKMASDFKLSSFNAALSNHFSPGQIKRLLNPNKRYRSWDSDDIASAISLRNTNPKAFQYLKETGFPLPASSTLRKWIRDIKLNSGVTTNLIKCEDMDINKI